MLSKVILEFPLQQLDANLDSQNYFSALLPVSPAPFDSSLGLSPSVSESAWMPQVVPG